MAEFTTEPEIIDMHQAEQPLKDYYIEKADKFVKEAQEELEAKLGSESRGVAWCDLFGVKTSEDGKRHLIKISLTSRSDVGPQHALDQLVLAVKEAQDKYHLTPYQP